MLKGALAGLIGGLAGSWAMNRFSSLFYNNGRGSMDDIATKLLAQRATKTITGRELSPAQISLAEPLVHYGLGTLTGAAYGALAEYSPLPTKAFGTAFGAAFWVAGDEIALPLLNGPSLPPSAHVEAFASHLVYALTTEGIRRAVRAAL